jgi:virginiamycin A acetyltransferase
MKSLYYQLLNIKPKGQELEKEDHYISMQQNPKYKNYHIGRFTYGEPSVMEWGEEAKLRIGSFCSIASDVNILLGGNHRTDWVTTFPFSVLWDEFQDIPGHPATNGDVIIGNDVWIGAGATILSGVVIGDGAVIGAKSVITKGVDPYTIVAGNPAKLIRKRFNSEVIDELLKVRWWDWDIDRIKEKLPLMLSTEVEEFLKRISSEQINQ